jgi:hypothetical protein
MLRALAARLAVAFLGSVFAAAAADTDYSDLWWNPAESGWGVGLQRQGDVIFLTLFVYGADGAGTWLIASSMQASDPSGWRWRGPLYRATGPAFSAPYDPNVQTTSVGEATIEYTGPSNGTLTYTVDGLRVTKSITRMTFREPSASGRYYGGFTTQVTSECVDPTRVGDYEFLGNMSVTHAGREASLTIASDSTGGPSSCTFSAATSQSGRLGTWSGTFNCSIFIGLDGRGESVVRVLRTGTFTFEQVTVTSSGFHGSLAAADQDCAFRGRLGGTRLP